MEYSDYKKEIEAMSAKISDFRGLFDLDGLQEAIADNESKMADPDFGTIKKKPKKLSMKTTN